jgi:hypothetical protein
LGISEAYHLDFIGVRFLLNAIGIGTPGARNEELKLRGWR